MFANTISNFLKFLVMMEKMKDHKKRPYINILLTLLFGSVIGVLTFFFMKALTEIELLQNHYNQGHPYHLVLIPVVLLVIHFIKKRTLYFPTRILHLSNEVSSQYWDVLMTPIHFLGTLLGHVSGVSIGRESAAVLYSAGLVRLFSLPWIFWGPVVSAIGFSAIVGQFWIAPIFMFEMFGRTSRTQKVYSFLGAMLAVTIIQALAGHSLFGDLELQMQVGFFHKFFFLLFFGASAGYLTRVYKKIYETLATYFNARPISVRILFSMLLALFLFRPEFRKFQSLGLIQISDITQLSGSFFDAISKLFFTLFATTLGFLGGEFIPFVYAGVHFGQSFFALFGHNSLTGAALGAYLLFTGATRFKWTGYFLILNIMGLGWWFWAYLVVSSTVGFSGPGSLYKSSET